MDTPIVKFVEEYRNSGIARFHMPGHKGVSFFGPEPWDITEIAGADDLSCPEGIVLESEKNASALFGTARTLYSTGGSTQSIHAMIYLSCLRAGEEEPCILAGRNAHKAFVHAAAKLGVRVKWLYPEEEEGICGCRISPEALEKALEGEKPAAVYVTSPDYLGFMADIPGLSRVCRNHGVPLLVDNAHGAYTAFLEPTLHPIHLGADLCCDSAHKTLPCLTGTGYLHIATGDRFGFSRHAVRAMSMFGSTSPSYLLLQSLDKCNGYLNNGIRQELKALAERVEELRRFMKERGLTDHSREPGKITLDLREFQVEGDAAATYFRKCGLEFEYADREFVVFMVSPRNSDADFEKLRAALAGIPWERCPRRANGPGPVKGKSVMSLRKAVFSPVEEVPVETAVGRICGAPTVACPPAVPVVVSGEEITGEHVALLKHYGIQNIWVVQESLKF